MSNEVQVAFGDSAKDNATLLLAAAEELKQEPAVVRTGDNVFYVPEDVAKKAGVDYEEPQPVGLPRVSEDQPAQEGDGSNEPKAEPAKKTAAKKSAAKKTAAKKSPAKKSAAKKSTAKKSTAKKSG